MQRRIAVDGPEDLYSVTLAAADLAQLRRDLGDVRIADDEGRQLPFIMEQSAATERVALVVARDQSRRESHPSRVSRYRLRIDAGSGSGGSALPWSGLELDVAEPFFDRQARLLRPGGDPRGGHAPLFSFALARSGAAGPPPPVTLALGGVVADELLLEIDDGDNAPLTPGRAMAVVNVPRLVFKAGKGGFRVLLGNAAAAAPSYDIAGLRQDVLAYSAVKLEAAGAEPNTSFRRRAGEYLDAPPTLLLWGALLAATVVLLVLTARILRQPPPGAPTGAGGAGGGPRA
jgi:hypothetical protein